ncbi:MAG: hypothetical protein ABW202_13905 [Duganella sp.]
MTISTASGHDASFTLVRIILEFQQVYWLPTFGWFAINIVIPVIGPLFLLWLVGFPPSTAPLASNNVLKSIGKGELLWAVMGMAAATCYELVSLQEIKTVKEWSSPIWIAFSLHLLLIVVAVLVVGLNSLDLPTGYVFSYPHVPDMRIFAGSILSLALVIVTYSATHATLTDQEERNAKIRREETDKKTMADKQAILDRIEQCLANVTGSGKHCVKEGK